MKFAFHHPDFLFFRKFCVFVFHHPEITFLFFYLPEFLGFCVSPPRLFLFIAPRILNFCRFTTKKCSLFQYREILFFTLHHPDFFIFRHPKPCILTHHHPDFFRFSPTRNLYFFVLPPRLFVFFWTFLDVFDFNSGWCCQLKFTFCFSGCETTHTEFSNGNVQFWMDFVGASTADRPYRNGKRLGDPGVVMTDLTGHGMFRVSVGLFSFLFCLQFGWVCFVFFLFSSLGGFVLLFLFCLKFRSVCVMFFPSSFGLFVVSFYFISSFGRFFVFLFCLKFGSVCFVFYFEKCWNTRET